MRWTEPDEEGAEPEAVLEVVLLDAADEEPWDLEEECAEPEAVLPVPVSLVALEVGEEELWKLVDDPQPAIASTRAAAA